MSEEKSFTIGSTTYAISTPITLTGWVDQLRTQKKHTFILLRCPPTFLQCVVRSELIPAELSADSYVRVSGSLQPLPEKARAELPVELQTTAIDILGPSHSDYAAECPPSASQQIKLEKRHLLFRHREFALMTRFRATVLRVLRQTLAKMGCTEIIPPCFTGTECEGGATLFPVQHPGRSIKEPMTAYLTQSSQFALEMALPGLGDVYCIYPSFRAEHSHTRRHLTEFLHCEAEWRDVSDLPTHVGKLKKMLTIFLSVLSKEPIVADMGLTDRLAKLRQQLAEAIILTHSEAIAMCAERGILKEDGTPLGPRDDIPEAQERALIDAIDKVVFLTRFPKEFKSFYMAEDPVDRSYVLGCDVEVPGVGEIIGSGVREGDHSRLSRRLVEQGLKPDDYREYLDLRKYGFGQTAGMGLGVDRLIVWLTGVQSIRQVVSFPRYPGCLRP